MLQNIKLFTFLGLILLPHGTFYCAQTTNIHPLTTQAAASNLIKIKKIYICPLCNLSCVCRSAFITHYNIHLGVKPFKCNHCNQLFSRKSHLKVHILCHLGVKPFQCNFCDKSFTQNSNLKSHTRTHSKEKPYSCSLCKRSFTSNSDLNRHTIIHTGKTHTQDIPQQQPTVTSNIFALELPSNALPYREIEPINNSSNIESANSMLLYTFQTQGPTESDKPLSCQDFLSFPITNNTLGNLFQTK